MTHKPLTKYEREIIRSVLYFYGHPAGWEPGGFTHKLILAYTSADVTNRAKFRAGFPEFADAMDLVNNDSNGIKKLAARLES